MQYSLTNTQTLLDLNLNRIHFCLWMLSEERELFVAEDKDRFLYRLHYSHRSQDSYPSYICKMTSPKRHLKACESEFKHWLNQGGKDCGFEWKENDISIKDCLKQLHKERRDLRNEFNLAKKERRSAKCTEFWRKVELRALMAFHNHVTMRMSNNCIGYKSVTYFGKRYKSHFLSFKSVICFTDDSIYLKITATLGNNACESIIKI